MPSADLDWARIALTFSPIWRKQKGQEHKPKCIYVNDNDCTLTYVESIAYVSSSKGSQLRR